MMQFNVLSLWLFLEGTAKDVYDDFADKSQIEQLLKELMDKCARPKEVLLTEFFQRRQRAGESMSKFGRAIQELLKLAEPGMSTENQTTLLKVQISQAFPEHMRELINFNPTMTWPDLLRNMDKNVVSKVDVT